MTRIGQVDHLEDVVEVAREQIHGRVLVGLTHAAVQVLRLGAEHKQARGLVLVLVVEHIEAAQRGAPYATQLDLLDETL